MRKSTLTLMAAVLTALSSCSRDELQENILTSDANQIRFSVNLGRSTRSDATETTVKNLGTMNVTALVTGTDTKYIDGADYVKKGSTYTTKDKYYWPKEGTLDFFAYGIADGTSGQYTKTDYKTFTITPSESTSANSQIDFVYANTNAKNNKDTELPVPINFRHAESQVNLMVKNTNKNLVFDITDWKVVYVSKSGKFTYVDDDTDGNGAAQLNKNSWSDLSKASVEDQYNHTLEKAVNITGEAAAQKLDGSMILVPQQQPKATKYAKKGEISKEGDPMNGAYLAVKMNIYNNDGDRTLIFDGGYACWPIEISWAPGFRYTYIIDLASGGYHENNDDPDDPDDPDQPLDPILSEIFFTEASVTVDEWKDADMIDVSM